MQGDSNRFVYNQRGYDTMIARPRNSISCGVTKRKRDVIVGITMQMLISSNTIKHGINAEYHCSIA